jgi:hypothetical protein
MVRLAFREKNPTGRRRLLVLLFLLIPVAYTITAVCFALDWILFPSLSRVKVRSPVFIIGHARSGTTLMHRLMTEDGDRFSCFLTYELFFPSLLQKKLIRCLGRCDRHFLGGKIARRIRKWEARSLAQTKDMHQMGLTIPEEDDFIFGLSCAAGGWIVLFPYMRELDFYYVDERPRQRRRRLMRFYKACVQRQLYLNGREKIHCSKNPVFSGRVESLIEVFPDARFVVMMRHPYETIPSLLKMLKKTWRAQGWKREEMEDSLELVARQSYHTYRYPLEALNRHPETKYAVVDYRDLVASPRKTMGEVYGQLGFSMSPEFDRVVAEEEARARTHTTTHEYSLREFGLDPAKIRGELGALFDRFCWDDEPPRPQTSEGDK